MERNLILYAEDDYDDFALVQEEFLNCHPELVLIHATRGRYVINSLADKEFCHKVSLIILDNNMPELDGKQTLKEIRNFPECNEVPVIVFSTSLSPSDLEYFEALGAKCYKKPVRMDTLSAMVKEFCGLRLVD
jgi:CheY-like chemotaxis protein